MVVATFRVELPELRRTVTSHPDLTVRLVETRSSANARIHAFVWLLGPIDAVRLSASLDADPTVSSARPLLSTDDGTLYRIEFDPDGPSNRAYEALIDLHGSAIAATTTDGTWGVRVFFPSRDELSRFFDRCRRLGLEPALSAVTARHDVGDGAGFGLTESQHHTLVAAVELGYFDVPKEVSLVELAEHLGVSDQAVSERLRRGMQRLVANTLLADDAPTDPPMLP
jgi:predicted DNA binding protein